MTAPLKQPQKYSDRRRRQSQPRSNPVHSAHGRTVLLVALLPDGEADGGTLQAEGAADLVFQIPLVGEVEQLGIVAEADEMGGGWMPAWVM